MRKLNRRGGRSRSGSLDRRELLQLASGALLGLAPLTGFGVVYLTAEKARAVIFPGEKLTRQDLELTPQQAREIQRRSGVRVRERQIEAWRSPTGHVVFIDRVLGKHEFITYACGIAADGTVRKIEILEYRETYGDEIRDEAWRKQFVGKRAADPLKLDGDIRNISGATLSCRHITDGVKRLLATFEIAIRGSAARTALARHDRRDRGLG